MRHIDDGYILIDALLSIFIIICMCGLCFSIFKVIINYENGYDLYDEKINNQLEILFNSQDYCEVCKIDEYD